MNTETLPPSLEATSYPSLTTLRKSGRVTPAELAPLIENALREPKAETELQRYLGLDTLNFRYFLLLLKRKLQKPNQTTQAASKTYLYAHAPKEFLSELPLFALQEIQTEKNRHAAKKAALWRKKMHAGIGSTIERKSHLEKYSPRSNRGAGAKGTDLFIPLTFENRDLGMISFCEALLLQGIQSAKKGEYKAVLFHDIISQETESAFQELWTKSCVANERYNYEEFVKRNDRLGRTRGIKQALLPTLNQDNQVTTNRLAPGGHALFAVEALFACLQKDCLPHATGKELISFISNGEDLSASPSPEMVGWMIENKIPISMVVTEKTVVDKKGGQISITVPESGTPYISILETAQAKSMGKLAEFESAHPAYFNTNMALINYPALIPRVTALVDKVGKDTFLEKITPDLIENWKEQVDEDGVRRKYLQLEGAMGSTLLNLDRLHRELFSSPLVHFITVPKENRHEYFAPIKTAFDFYMQFHSDRFIFDSAAIKPINKRPGAVPSIELKDTLTMGIYWADVETVLSNFNECSIFDLDSLEVEGQISFESCRLEGNVSFKNTGPFLKIKDLVTNTTFKNCSVVISKRGEITISSLPS